MADNEEIRRALIIRQDRIGDTILTLPLATALKKSNPGVKVDFLVRGYTAPLVRRYEDADFVILLDHFMDKKPDFLAQELIGQDYDLVILPNATEWLATAVFIAQIRNRRSGGLRWYMWRFNRWMMQSRKRPKMNELDYNFQMLKDFADIPERDQVRFQFQNEKEEQERIDGFLSQNGIHDFVILHPGSGGSALDLPVHIWSEIISANPFGKQVLLTGSEAEKELCASVIAKSGASHAINVAGHFNLCELMELISRASFFMANSTGPLHMARAMNVPLLGIYSTFRACHPIRWGPYGMENTHTLIPPGENFESFAKSKELSRRNMERITLDRVLEKINTIYPAI